MGRHAAASSADRPWRRTQLAASLVLLAAGALGLHTAVSASDAGPSPSEPAATAEPMSVPTRLPTTAEPTTDARPRSLPRAVDWVSVLEVLDRRRALAFQADDPALLEEVYLPGTAPLRDDRALLASYARRGLRVQGLAMTLLDVRLLRAGPRRALLRVVDRVSGGDLVTAAGFRRAAQPDRPTTRLIRLVRPLGPGWRIAAITPLPPPRRGSR